jgi:hypothetical protein
MALNGLGPIFSRFPDKSSGSGFFNALNFGHRLNIGRRQAAAAFRDTEKCN